MTEYLKSIKIIDLTDEELGNLARRLGRMTNVVSEEFRRQVIDEHRFRMGGPVLGDEFPFPLGDAHLADIVRCVHEGCCPVCGRDARVVEEWEPVWLPDDNWMRELNGEKVRCLAGHEASAEPSEGGTDWNGWIDKGDLQ